MLDLLVTTSVPYYSSDKAAGVFLFLGLGTSQVGFRV